MKLRSQTVLEDQVRVQQAVYKPSWPKAVQEFTPEFFDDSSNAWRANKVEVAKGIYKYKKEVKEIVGPVRKSPRLQKHETVENLRRSPRFAK
jgi:hypothetical protein